MPESAASISGGSGGDSLGDGAIGAGVACRTACALGAAMLGRDGIGAGVRGVLSR